MFVRKEDTNNFFQNFHDGYLLLSPRNQYNVANNDEPDDPARIQVAKVDKSSIECISVDSFPEGYSTLDGMS